jgi:hypothetical protein
MHQLHELKYWTKALVVSADTSQRAIKAINKVKNSAAVVRKQLSSSTAGRGAVRFLGRCYQPHNRRRN